MASAIRSYLLTVMADIYLQAADYDKGLAVLEDINNNAEYFLKAQRYHLRGKLLLMKNIAGVTSSNSVIQEASDCFMKSIDCAKSKTPDHLKYAHQQAWQCFCLSKAIRVRLIRHYSRFVEWFDKANQSADVIEAQAILSECEKTRLSA